MNLSKEHFFEYVRYPEETFDGKLTRTTRYYMDVYDHFSVSDERALKWNWAAAFFGFLWFFYRRMIWEAFAYKAIFVLYSLFLVLLFSLAPTGGTVILILLLFVVGWFVIPGYLGNWFYVSFIKRSVEKDAEPKNPNKWCAFLGVAVLALLNTGLNEFQSLNVDFKQEERRLFLNPLSGSFKTNMVWGSFYVTPFAIDFVLTPGGEDGHQAFDWFGI